MSEVYVFLPDCGRLVYRRGRVIGCLLALSYASMTSGDIPSVRMTLPIDMKNLSPSGNISPFELFQVSACGVFLPECGS